MAEETRYYVRFPLVQRIEHIVLLTSFSALGLTGLIQKFAGNAIAEFLIKVLGGVGSVRVIHHASAIIFALLSIYHVIVLLYKIFVQRVELSMLPGVRDITDALDVVRYNLGLTKERPKLPRYAFDEKAEYWALVWGGIVMGLTGFILWNPILAAKFLPGQIIPAAKAAHGLEAILAVAAIFIWHFYHVHLKLFNKSMFTGKLTREQMLHEHGEELERLESGKLRPAPPAEVLRRRERVFIPVAAVMAIVMVGALIFLTTYETTAISTVPPAAPNVPAFSPLTPTPVATPQGGVDNTKVGAAMKHEIAGKEQCLTCHGPKGVSPMPSNHEGRPQESCLVCHKPGPTPTPGAAKPGATKPAGVAGAIPHALEGKEKCDQCHAGVGSLKPVPADHTGRANTTCTACHQLAGQRATPAAGATSAPAGTAKAIPANHTAAADAFKDCVACHGAGRMKPGPANHASFTNDLCQSCHKSASGATAAATPAATATSAAGATPAATATTAAGTAKAIPANHASDGFKDCVACHGAGKMKPGPANHASFTNDTCQTCHKPAGGATPAATATPAAGAAPTAAPATGTAKAIPANHASDGFKDCAACHGVGKMKPGPATHASFTNDTCQTCHKPAEK
jgi:cytochrome b subunit of formate dehydrogenase